MMENTNIILLLYYPRQLQIQSFQGTTYSKFDIPGLQLLDKIKIGIILINYLQKRATHCF
jgi:hypothetical protein